MRLRFIVTASMALALLAGPASAGEPEYVPGEVVVKYDDERARTVDLDRGESVPRAAAKLSDDPDVEYAVPNYKARLAGFYPNDRGMGTEFGQWTDIQWNFAGPFGVNAPDAWELSRFAGAGGGRGVVVAVMDTGVAYRKRGRFHRAPDLYARRFTKPYDFVDNDRFAQDKNNHGTHVTGTIAQKTHNRRGVTGLAYGVKIMPLRVLNAAGEGDGRGISRAIRYAARKGADVINMSLQFDVSLTTADVPEVVSAIRFAHRKGVVMVAPTGNEFEDSVALPARARHVISVGAITEHGCQADYSNGGRGIDLVAPGGGADAPNFDNPADRENCSKPGEGREIYQETFTKRFRSFKLVPEVGTSFASPHVAAVAALVIATRRVGRKPKPAAVERRLKETARDLGPPGHDDRYGAGLVDAAAALAP